MLDILRAYETGSNTEFIKGIVSRKNNTDLDQIAFPARDLFPNEEYIKYGKKKTGCATTTVFTTRGCPFRCEFCSNAVFGVSYRERSPINVLDEVEEALSFGYDRIHFADDVFTLNQVTTGFSGS